jgi:hypothetical protein
LVRIRHSAHFQQQQKGPVERGCIAFLQRSKIPNPKKSVFDLCQTARWKGLLIFEDLVEDIMANKSEQLSGSPSMLSISDQTEAMFEMQKEVLKAYEEAGRAWIERVKSEVTLWSALAAKLGASRTMPEGFQACQDAFAQHMQMVADDGRHLFEDGQKIVASISRTMSNGWPKKSS